MIEIHINEFNLMQKFDELHATPESETEKRNKLVQELNYKHLAPAIAALSPEQRRILASWNDGDAWLIIDDGPDLLLSTEEMFGANYPAYIRGEKPFECTCTSAGINSTERHTSGMEVRMTYDFQGNDHALCHSRRAWKSVEPAWMPAKFRDHRTLNLRPYTESPFDVTAQVKPLGMLSELVESICQRKQRSWLLFGPAGCSKTTYIAAVLRDEYTYRWSCCELNPLPETGSQYLRHRNRQLGIIEPPKQHAERIGIYRIKVPDWLAETQAYDTREFGDPTVKESSVSPESIRRNAEGGFPPILWLEELDKFNPTRTRLNYLYRLVDAVYELGGCIVASANLTAEELEEHVGEPIYRRLSGPNDDDGEYTIMDFHALAGKAGAGKLKRKIA